ncbi:O-sialoglycoprotein endopeptidase [Thermosulfidibacter takaii ABI70S6]|uniref:tRNA N6-adenosine threonylcarbamoyltransferase n=1 Tax=Thermosulfidibacter takaii (strain DSM 17441 / JCM 13301 / NBRC 103674 / ABI70S6) TaxID=1298851 RepID=A0A0S3QSA4_THET7|nr:tRNA (adenosine(37)-N6)-threonylcarbamoyltransferase complex transferase subunit TsaD [Thermosulfidibacter takaii]BAT71216.1 O-sialoglycoprotein endopeptidase [Thermosulfidibacter takaii ABI70S6]
MIVLGIETSCDDTGVAILKDKEKLLANFLSSQVELHKVFGGVVPEIAARKHLDTLLPLTVKAFEAAEVNLEDVDCVAVTNRPGLVPSLIVGVTYAKGIAYALNKPLVTVNHLEAHAFAMFLERKVPFPFVALVVSGGHTSLFLVEDFGELKYLGGTLDDAAGEAFDKVAKAMGLGYPGGPVIDQLAREGDPNAIAFPVAKTKDYTFSFSGLKTAVIGYIQKHPNYNKVDVAASFQEAVVKALLEKTLKAVEEFKVKNVVVSGGVACNSWLRKRFLEECGERDIKVHFPSPKFCTDNAAMVAFVGSYRFERGEVADLSVDVYSRATF